MVFGTKSNSFASLELNLPGAVVKQANTVNYLINGVKLDPRLSYSPHVEHIRSKLWVKSNFWDIPQASSRKKQH